MRRAMGGCLAALLGVVTIGLAPGPTHAPRAAAASITTRYIPLQPCRVADTRESLGFRGVDPYTARVELTTCGIPADAEAIVATTTIANARSTGWLVAYPSGSSRPTAAMLNWTWGITRGNSSVIAVGDDRSIDVFKSDAFGPGDVVIDVVGAFVPAPESADGRLVTPTTAQRLLDTRPGDRPTSGSTIRVPLPAGVPSDATALAVNVSAARTTTGGFFTAFPAGTERPIASTLNVDRADQTRSAATIVPVNAEGFDVFVERSSHVIIDMTGWFTGPSAASSADGLFVPMSPRRLRDTRPETYPLYTDGTIEIGIPSDLAASPSAVALNMTMVSADDRGYITAHPARTERGATASGYGLPNENTAQFAITSVSDVGVSVYSERGTDLIVDLLGWFTGDSTPMTTSTPATNPVRLQRVIAIGDSSMAGVDRNYANHVLRGAQFTFLARSCRRLVRDSCRGREGPIPPPTAQDTLRSVTPGQFDVAVIMTGYNDVMPNVYYDVPKIVTAAREAGIRRIVWLTMAREFRSDKGGPGAYQVYDQHNVVIRSNANAHFDMQAFEWSAIVRQVPHWVYWDGIHLDRHGGYGAADFISRAVAHVTGQPCPMPEYPGGPTAGVCPDPGQRPPIDVGRLYGV